MTSSPTFLDRALEAAPWLLPAVIAALVLALAVHLARRLREGAAEDRAFESAAATLGARQLIVWDTRLTRPFGLSIFGASTAVDALRQALRDEQREWLVPIVSGLDVGCPIGVRVLLAERGGVPVAFAAARARVGPSHLVLAALAPSGRPLERRFDVAEPLPPADLVESLDALAAEGRG